jgi:hypothetical protein
MVQGCIQAKRAGLNRKCPETDSKGEEKAMKQTFFAVTAIGMAWLLISMAPDIRRYMRMRAM